MAAAMSKSIPGGIGITACAATTTCWAKPPWAVKAITLSPTVAPVTPAPTVLMMPEISPPGVNGNAGLIWYLP